MLGAIIGDIVGSVYESNNIKSKDFPFFRDDCTFTDDTVMTVATADALMRGGERDDFIDAYKEWGRRYPNVRYGAQFRTWMMSDDREPYNSWGNGSAMRVSPCAWLMDCAVTARTGELPAKGRDQAKLSAEVTHNHPEGVKGALAVTDAIFMCRYFAGGYGDDTGSVLNERLSLGEFTGELKSCIERVHGYDLSRTLDEIRPGYRFSARCQDTVPEAITAFLEATDFEDAIRNAISLGGDSDTLAAMAGSIAEVAFGVPEAMREKALAYLDGPLREVIDRWESHPCTNIGVRYKKGHRSHRMKVGADAMRRRTHPM